MINRRLWGLSLLERTVRELDKLGFQQISVSTTKDIDPLRYFCHPAPKSVKLSVIFEASKPFESLIELLGSEGLVMVLEGHVINDRRVIKELMAVKTACAVVMPSGGNFASAALLSAQNRSLFQENTRKNLTAILSKAIKRSQIAELDLSNFREYVENLRRKIPPFLQLIDNEQQLKEADELLRKTVHKGVLEFVAKYIHPPMEFGTVKLIAHTRISPNLITIIWLILAGLTIPLFATGHLLMGCILAAISGVLDGVDGKLARLTLRFSKTGDLLDHIGGTFYDAIWYLALGWYFSKGDLNSTAAHLTYVLFGTYIVNRVVPGIFRKLHGSEIYDYAKIDTVARLIGSRMNNNIWLMLVGIILGLARKTFYAISLWMLATAIWHSVRLFYVTLRNRGNRALAN